MSAPDEETKRALREFLDEVDRVIGESVDAGKIELLLWKLYRDAGITPICVHCGDWTEPFEDPSPTLCAMCAKAGRT
jgi:hypothetical protein